MSYKRKQRASTGAHGRFGTGIVTNPRPRDYLHDEAPEDIRFERFINLNFIFSIYHLSNYIFERFTEKVYAEKTAHVRQDGKLFRF
jgi:hypothetical protein